MIKTTNPVLLTVLQQSTKSLCKLQKYLLSDHSIHRAAASGDIFTSYEHLKYNDFTSKFPDPIPTATNDPNDHTTKSPYAIQSSFYKDFLPTYMSENASVLKDWKYEQGSPPPNAIFDDIILQFYQNHLPNETMTSRAEAADLLQFFPEYFPASNDDQIVEVLDVNDMSYTELKEFGMLDENDDGNADEETDDEQEQDYDEDDYEDEDYDLDDEDTVYILGEHDEDQTGSTAWTDGNDFDSTDSDSELTAGRDFYKDDKAFNERWLLNQLEQVGGPANFIRQTVAQDWETLLEEGYILEPDAIRSGIVIGESKDEEIHQSIILTRNISLGFCILRKLNTHIDYIDSLIEDELFVGKVRGYEEDEYYDVEEEENENEDNEDKDQNDDNENEDENDILPHLDFCVGHSIQHKFFGNGVIIGWDKMCTASDSWCTVNKVDTMLVYGRDQPFYNILFEDGEHRYCSQENLNLRDVAENAAPIQHKAVGYFFVDYNKETGLHILTEHLRKRYPEDEIISGANNIEILKEVDDLEKNKLVKDEKGNGNSVKDEEENTKDTVRAGLQKFIKLRENR